MMSVLGFLIVLSLSLATPANAQGLNAIIEQALDEPAMISLSNVELGKAFEMVSQQTGIDIVMSRQAREIIPGGLKTKVNAEIRNIPVRKGLTDLVSPLGMTFVVDSDHVVIVPKPALLCLGRPATWDEIDTVVALSALQPGKDPTARESLRDKIQFQVPDEFAWRILDEALSNTGAGPGDEALTAACENLGWMWCPVDKHIVVASREQAYRRQLQRPIMLRMTNRPLFSVLQSIGREVGVPVRAEPGTLQALPVETQRSFSANITQQTAEEAFDTIAAYTGLGYFINSDGVLFYMPEEVRKAAEKPQSFGNTSSAAQLPQSASDPYVAKIVIDNIDGQTVEWLVRASELPEDLLRKREADIAAFIEAVRKAGGDTNP